MDNKIVEAQIYSGVQRRTRKIRKTLVNREKEDIPENDKERVRRGLQRFFHKVALPHLSSQSRGGGLTRSKELAELAVRYFFEEEADELEHLYSKEFLDERRGL